MIFGRKLKTISAVLPALRELKISRRPPGVEHGVFYTTSADGVELFCTLLGRNPEKVVVVAHPAVVGGYYEQVLSLAEILSKSFSVVLFDFRGHGRSGGRCPVGFQRVSEDLEAVIDRVRRMGFTRVGVAGFSMGAAASMILASRKDCFDCLASIGCPPRVPDIPMLKSHRFLSRAAARLLGMRLEPTADEGPSPVDIAGRLPGFPKLLVFGEWEVVPAEEISGFVGSISEPKTLINVPGAWHADLMGREEVVREWFEANL